MCYNFRYKTRLCKSFAMLNLNRFPTQQMNRSNSSIWKENTSYRTENIYIILPFQQVHACNCTLKQHDLSTDFKGLLYINKPFIASTPLSPSRKNSTKEGPWLLELETLIPLKQYWANHNCYSSYSNREEQPLVWWTMSRTWWSYWWQRSHLPLWN